MTKVFYHVLFCLFWMNIFDGIFTAYLVEYGFAREVNPIMNFLIEKSVWLFLSFKILAGSAVIVFMRKGIDFKSLRMAIFLCSLVYFWVIINHFAIIHHLIQTMRNFNCL